MLSVSPLQYPSGSNDPPPIYPTPPSESQDLWTVDVETIHGQVVEGGIDITVDPMTPTGVQAHVGMAYDTRIDVSWNEVDGAAGYRVQVSNDGITWSTATSKTTALSTEYWNRQRGKEYFYRVASFDANDNLSDWSDRVSARCPTQLDAPELSVLFRDENIIVLEWTKIDNAVDYHLSRSEDGGQTWLWTHGTSGNSYVFTSSSSDTVYLFRVNVAVAENGYGTSPASNICYSNPVVDDSFIPFRPGGLSAVPMSSSSVAVSWDAASGAVSYRLEMKTSFEGTWTTIYEGDDTEYICNDLAATTVCFFRVRSINDSGVSDPSYEVSALPAMPSTDPMTPRNVRCNVKTTHGDIAILWDAVDGAVSYQVQRSMNGIDWTTIVTTSNFSYTYWSHQEGVEYFYRVASIDALNGVSEYSAVVTTRLRTTLDVPALSCKSRTENAILLEWPPVENAQNYFLEVSKDGGQSWSTVVHSTASTTWACNVSDDPHAEYRFRISVRNADSGYRPSPSASDILVCPAVQAAADIPARPNGLRAESPHPTRLAVSWNTVPGADSYKLETADSPDGTWATVYEGTDTEYICTNLSADTFCYYRATAVNAAGTSSTSYIISAKTK